MKRVLILGASGEIGPVIVPELETHYDLRLADIAAYPDGRAIQTIDITNYEQVCDAARDMDAIVNLTVVRQDRDSGFAVNVAGAWNMMRAAAEQGIKKVIQTGPQCLRYYYDHEFGIADVPNAPGTHLYSLTKSLSYEICRIFARRHGIQTICFHFNGVRPRPDGPQRGVDYPPMTIVHDDLVHACRLALEIESVPDAYQEFIMLSYEGQGKYSLDKARRILGFEPLERWEDYYKWSG